MFNIILFTKTTDFYIDIVNNFLEKFIISVIVINKKSELNTNYIKYLKTKNIPFIIHPYRKFLKSTEKFINNLKKFKIDYIFTIFYPQILTKEIINLSKFNSFNFHPGRLPNQRGAHILNWLIIKNKKQSCVTVHELKEEIDSGKILYEEKYIITKNDTINDLIKKSNNIVLIIISKLEKLLKNGKEKLYENKGIDKYYRPRTIKDSQINPKIDSIMSIYNKNRALVYPYPGIFWYQNGKKFESNKFLTIHEIEKMFSQSPV